MKKKIILVEDRVCRSYRTFMELANARNNEDNEAKHPIMVSKDTDADDESTYWDCRHCPLRTFCSMSNFGSSPKSMYGCNDKM
jgi:hypothetical protein